MESKLKEFTNSFGLEPDVFVQVYKGEPLTLEMVWQAGRAALVEEAEEESFISGEAEGDYVLVSDLKKLAGIK